MAAIKSTAQTAQLTITLCDLDPDIWRRVLVPHDIALPDLHAVIQIAMGWDDSHMHSFTTKTAIYNTIDENDFFGSAFPGVKKTLDETKHRLSDLLTKPKAKCVYTYDFGDSWKHDIVLEKLIPVEKRLASAEVIAGENACPPDDCGGVPGYCDLVEILFNPKDPEYADRREWLGLKKGEKFDPMHYDIAAANKRLRRFKI